MSTRRISAAALVLVVVGAALSQVGSLVTHAPTDPTHRVDVNSASVSELELLPRIGPKIASAIVASREAEGRFSEVDDLDRVPRIGEKTVAGLRPYAVAR